MKNIKVQLLFLGIHFLCNTNSNASNKDAKSFKETQDVYECLPQIAIPGIRKIIGEYAHNVLLYRLKFYTNLLRDTKVDLEKLTYARIASNTTPGGTYSMVITPEDKQKAAMHLNCYDEVNKPGLSKGLQEDIKPFCQYNYAENNELRLTFMRHDESRFMLGNFYCFQFVPDDQAVHAANLIANEALEKARFIETSTKIR